MGEIVELEVDGLAVGGVWFLVCRYNTATGRQGTLEMGKNA